MFATRIRIAGAALLLCTLVLSSCSDPVDLSDENDSTTTTQASSSNVALECGDVPYLGEVNTLTVSGTTCDEARGIVATHDSAQPLPDGWNCFFGREGEPDLLTCSGPQSARIVLKAR